LISIPFAGSSLIILRFSDGLCERSIKLDSIAAHTELPTSFLTGEIQVFCVSVEIGSRILEPALLSVLERESKNFKIAKCYLKF